MPELKFIWLGFTSIADLSTKATRNLFLLAQYLPVAGIKAFTGCRYWARLLPNKKKGLAFRLRPPFVRLESELKLMAKDGERSARSGRHQIIDPFLASGTAVLLRELVSHLRQNRTELREGLARCITEAQLLTAMSKDGIFAEATAVHDQYVEALETGTFESLQAYARSLSITIPQGD